MNYKFDPTKFGYEPIDLFPQIVQERCHLKGFIKVTASTQYLDKPEYDPHIFWFQICYKTVCRDSSDDRWTIESSVVDMRKDSEISKPSTKYAGIISSEEFANMLLSHLMSTTTNDSITIGESRLNDRSLNSDFKKFT